MSEAARHAPGARAARLTSSARASLPPDRHDFATRRAEVLRTLRVNPGFDQGRCDIVGPLGWHAEPPGDIDQLGEARVIWIEPTGGRYRHGVSINYQWRGTFTNREVNALHAEAFSTRVFDESEWNWLELAGRHSLGWMVARDGDDLAGFVNVLWDGLVHAPPLVLPWCLRLRSDQRRPAGTELSSGVMPG